MSEPARAEEFSLTLVGGIAASPAQYLLEAAAQLAAVHPELRRYYCQIGLLGDTRGANRG